MAIKSTPFYWSECDGCGARAEYEGGDISAWAEPDQAEDEAIDKLDWERLDDDRLVCDGCRPELSGSLRS
jgi:hypothetical protein